MRYKPIIHKFTQRSDEWINWRKGGLGASEMSVIAGSLPFEYEDILDLYKKKAGLPVDDFIMTEAIQKGIDTEDEALEAFTKITGIKMEPICVTHSKYPFLRASLDGADKKLKTGVEIKCPGTTKFYQAKKGIVLPYYYTQIQMQAESSGIQEMYYWVYRSDQGGILFKIPRNEEYIQELIRRAKIFWDMVERKEPCLPRHLGIDIYKESDPFIAGEHITELVGVYKN